ncbi:MAG: N-acetylglucosamine kinase [Bacteroidia bacterium]|nr:N-acetylglucosamine kinase [Bacteroidia bacterium]
MILVADSGSTKTDWCLIDDNSENKFFETKGFNPYLNTEKEITEELISTLISQLSNTKITNIYFYGAGCANEKLCSIVEFALIEVFPESQIQVEHDLLGAARALCQNEAGIAVILGTGSNSCVYDGKNIIQHIPALGYTLGDEGAGSQIGKQLLKAYLHQQLPKELNDSFQEQYNSNFSEVMETIYKKPFPNRYMSSFCPFVSQNISNPFCKALVKRCFEDFFVTYISKYDNIQSYTFNCVGSIGYYFKDILKEVALQFGIKIGTIVQKPMDGLIKYHTKN